MAAPAEGCGHGRDPRDRWQSSSTLAEVTEFKALGHAPAPAPGPLVQPRGAPRGPAERRGTGPGAAARGRDAGRGPPSATRGRRSAARSAEQCAAAPPLTSHVAVQAARRGPDCPGHCGIATPGCPPRERELPGSGSREHGERPDSSGCGERLWHVAVQPLIAARRFPPLRGPSPAPAPPGRRADAPSSHAQPRPPPARPPARPGPRRSPPLQLPGLRAQTARPARLDGRLESAARPAAQPPRTRKAKGGKEAARVFVGIFLGNQHSQFWSSARKLIITQNTNTRHLPVSSANKTCSLKAPLLPTLQCGVQKASRAPSFKIK